MTSLFIQAETGSQSGHFVFLFSSLFLNEERDALRAVVIAFSRLVLFVYALYNVNMLHVLGCGELQKAQRDQPWWVCYSEP